ncbi:transposase [Streptomyces lydicus]|uniref:transposase n=1 Tax=Streptomyces lydicus TaxID=47763 RepID=UPI0037A2BB74
MGRGDLTNEEWARLLPHLPANGGRGRQWSDHRRVLNGIYFRERTGVPWRDLPARYGKWKTVYERHRRWSNEVERMINRLKGFRAVATRYDKRAYVFHGTVTTAAIRLWLR